MADFCNFFEFGGHGTEASSQLAEEPLAISQNAVAFVKNEKFVETIKCETEFIRTTPTPPFDTYPLSQCPSPIEAPDIFDMSSFFQDNEKTNAEGVGDFDDLLATPPSGAFPEGSGVKTSMEESPSDQPSGGSTETAVTEELLDADPSVDSVVMGIPYYVACQWQQMQQQHQQQQQAVMMLWWQAYLSGAYNMMGPTTKPPLPTSTQVNWPFAHGLSFYGEDSLANHPLGLSEECTTTTSPKKRRKPSDSSELSGNGSKKGRRSKQTERVCKNCGTNATPFWRKDKQDGRPLCNACGLYLSKNSAPRPKVLWKYNERSPPVLII